MNNFRVQIRAYGYYADFNMESEDNSKAFEDEHNYLYGYFNRLYGSKRLSEIHIVIIVFTATFISALAVYWLMYLFFESKYNSYDWKGLGGFRIWLFREKKYQVLCE